MEVEIRTETKTRQYEDRTYHWRCPDCGERLYDDVHPNYKSRQGDKDKLRCYQCYRAKVTARFDEYLANFKGSSITRLVPYGNDEPDLFKAIEIVDSRGQAWMIWADVLEIAKTKGGPPHTRA